MTTCIAVSIISYMRPSAPIISDDAGAVQVAYPLRFSFGMQTEQFPNFTGAAKSGTTGSPRRFGCRFSRPGEHMKICLVTAFPPSRRGLNEYGFHLARELGRDPLLSLTILADELDSMRRKTRRLRRDALLALRLVWQSGTPAQAIHDIKPDVVWFNLLFSTFGNNPVPAFSGLTQPALSRLTGHYTHVTLHHLMDNIDLADSGVRFPRLYRAAGIAATRMLLMANSISVLLPVYRRTLD